MKPVASSTSALATPTTMAPDVAVRPSRVIVGAALALGDQRIAGVFATWAFMASLAQRDGVVRFDGDELVVRRRWLGIRFSEKRLPLRDVTTVLVVEQRGKRNTIVGHELKLGTSTGVVDVGTVASPTEAWRLAGDIETGLREARQLLGVPVVDDAAPQRTIV